MPENLTLADAISHYLRRIKTDDRTAAAQALSRFARWYGGERTLRDILPGDLERYQDQLNATGGDSTRLEPLRQFFSDARQRKLLERPLASHVRIRRTRGSHRLKVEGFGQDTVELTRSGFEALQSDLARLETVEQPRARDDLRRAAADKDFRENAPYDAAKQHLAELTRRANEIRIVLGRATIVDEVIGGKAGLGATVVLLDLDENEELTYTLVGPGEIDARRGKISVQSPVGRALSDSRVGETVEVTTPAGLTRYRVLEIKS